MKTIRLAVLFAAVVTGPVLAQPAPYQGYDAEAFWRGTSVNPIDRIQILKDRIDRAEANGSIDPGEAHRVRDELGHTWEWIHRMHYEDGGHLGPEQRAEVQTHLDQISQQIRWLRRDGWLAQPASYRGYDAEAFWRGTSVNPIERIEILKDRVDHAEANGSIEPGEAHRVRDELGQTWEWIHRMHYEDGGHLSPEQRAGVQARLDRISQQIRWLRRDGW